MRLRMLTAPAFLACCASAFAADMPLKAPPPPPAPVFTWTGCYLGGSVGGIWRQTNNTDSD